MLRLQHAKRQASEGCSEHWYKLSSGLVVTRDGRVLAHILQPVANISVRASGCLAQKESHVSISQRISMS